VRQSLVVGLSVRSNLVNRLADAEKVNRRDFWRTKRRKLL